MVLGTFATLSTGALALLHEEGRSPCGHGKDGVVLQCRSPANKTLHLLPGVASSTTFPPFPVPLNVVRDGGGMPTPSAGSYMVSFLGTLQASHYGGLSSFSCTRGMSVAACAEGHPMLPSKSQLTHNTVISKRQKHAWRWCV